MRLAKSRLIVVKSATLDLCLLLRLLLFLSVRSLLLDGRVIIIENHIVIVLLNKASQIEMLGQKSHQFVRGTIIGNKCWLTLHMLKHYIEESASMATSLHT